MSKFDKDLVSPSITICPICGGKIRLENKNIRTQEELYKEMHECILVKIKDGYIPLCHRDRRLEK